MNSREYQYYQEALLAQQQQQQQREMDMHLQNIQATANSLAQTRRDITNSNRQQAMQQSVNRTMNTADMLRNQRQGLYNNQINQIDRRTTETWDRINDNVNGTITHRYWYP